MYVFWTFFTEWISKFPEIFGSEMISETCLLGTGNKLNAQKTFRRWKIDKKIIRVINLTLLIKWNYMNDHVVIRATIEIFLVLLRHGQSFEFNMLYILLLKCLRNTSVLVNRFNYNYQVTFWEVDLFKQFHTTGLFLYLTENIRKPEVFWCFTGVQKELVGWNGLNNSFPDSSKLLLL